ncbi:hypothetical protein BH11BAC2_BH11BAC2_06490 [soil metagenome]
MSKRFNYSVSFLAVLIPAFLLFSAGCKPRQKAQSNPVTTITRPMEEKSVQDLLDSLETNSFKAKWMTAKASVTTNQDGNETSFNINMRFKRDSVIWISVSPLLGIEVARVMVTPDSVKLLDRLHNKYEVNTFESINKLLQLKVNFEIVQALITGNFFAYRKSENKFNSVFMEEKYYILSSLTKHQLRRSLEEKDPNKPVIQDVYINEQNFRITKMSVEDQRISKVLLTNYSDFRMTDAGFFPFRSDTKISAEKNFEIKIEFGKVNTGEPLEFPFNVPNNYERKH